MSEDLFTLEFGQIVSVDNDLGCIELMRGRYKDLPALKWIHCDLVTHEGIEENQGDLVNDSYDLVIDKGTFDAVLVEGSVSPMLAEVYRMLKPGGAYVLCSLNSEDFLQRLLCPRLIGWKATFYICDEKTRIVVCKKKLTAEVNWAMVAEEEKRTVDEHFTKEKPLVTESVEAAIRSKFVHPLGLEAAHEALFKSKIFSHEDMLGYDLQLFLEDLKNFPLTTADKMSADEAVAFLKAMQ